MARVSRTRSILEDFVRDGSFRWLKNTRSLFEDEAEEMEKSASEGNSLVPELSPAANIVVRKCSRILGVPVSDLQKEFDTSASSSLKDPSHYACNLLEFCCFKALALSTHVSGHLGDKKFRRLTFDMMLAWEAPAASSEPLLNVDEDATVGKESFHRIAPAVPIISNVVIVNNLYEVLTASHGGRLQYATYEKYLIGLERATKRLKTQSESSLLSVFRSGKGERVLEIDGTVTTQPVLQHIGVSTWPGRLTLTDHALYFEPLRVVSYDQAKRYDLEEDLKQVVKPEMTGPWGTRLFDKAVSYRSIHVSEPVVMEFPELKGNNRRDYWLAIIQEILFVHRFIRKFQLTGNARDEALFKAVIGILQLQAIQEIASIGPIRYDSLLVFSLCDNLPRGDLILETFASMLTSRDSERTSSPRAGSSRNSVSAFTMSSSLRRKFGSSSIENIDPELVVGDIVVGSMTPLERAVKESRSNYEKVVSAQETVAGVKADDIDTNLALMKELLYPMMEICKSLQTVYLWEDPVKSITFCLIFSYIIIRGWIGYFFAFLLVLVAIFMVMSRCCAQDEGIDGIKVIAPPPKSKMEQILALQNAVSQTEEAIQDANIVLLKMRALMLAIFPQASDKCAFGLLVLALILLMPVKYFLLTAFLEASTRYSPPRKAATERFKRRLKEWWFSIPAAPVILETDKENKKRK